MRHHAAEEEAKIDGLNNNPVVIAGNYFASSGVARSLI